MKTIVQLVEEQKEYFLEKDTAAKQAVEANIAPVEADPSSASRAYVVGEQLFLNDVLYDVTSPISFEGAIVVGTNITAANKLSADIKSIMNQANDMVNVLGAKNIVKSIVNVLYAAGMTYTLNADGSISVQGTSTEMSYCQVCEEFILKKGKYILSGCPDVNGESTKALLYIPQFENVLDYGDGITFTVNSDTAIIVNIRIDSGVTFSTPVIFYPMIRLASIKDATYVPYSMTNREMTPYVQAISNPNLLDNPWFTVNQRGQASYNNIGYTVDRWTIGYGDTICDVTNNGITLSSSILGSTYAQLIEEDFYNKFIAGKDVTLSVLLTDGTIKSVTGHAPVNTSYYRNIGVAYITDTCTLTLTGKTGENEQVQIRFTEANSDAISIRAVKLELGSVSTLAMDTAPNYTTELLKCQRYFYKTLQFDDNGMNVSPNQCLAVSATRLQGIKFPVQMRANPTVTVNKVNELGGSVTISGVTAQWNSKEGISYFSITGATVGSSYVVDFEASADL